MPPAMLIPSAPPSAMIVKALWPRTPRLLPLLLLRAAVFPLFSLCCLDSSATCASVQSQTSDSFDGCLLLITNHNTIPRGRSSRRHRGLATLRRGRGSSDQSGLILAGASAGQVCAERLRGARACVPVAKACRRRHFRVMRCVCVNVQLIAAGAHGVGAAARSRQGRCRVVFAHDWLAAQDGRDAIEAHGRKAPL